MSPTWSAMPISPDNDFAGAPLLRGEFALDAVTDPWSEPPCTPRPRGVRGLPQRSPGPTTCSARGGAATSGGCATAATTSPRCSADVGSGLALGNGWYRGRLAWSGVGPSTATGSAPSRSSRSTFADGHRQLVVTDETWTAGPSRGARRRPLRRPDDRRPAPRSDAWLHRAAADGWTGVRQADFDTATLTPYVGPPVVRHEDLDRSDLDVAGRPHAGRLRAEPGRLGAVHGARRGRQRDHRSGTPRCSRTASWASGRCGRPRPPTGSSSAAARTLRADDHLPRLPLRRGHRLAAASSTTDGLAGGGRRHSDLRRTGCFECSDALLNQLHRNVVWGTTGNFLDLPTDCPQRDERLGWTGDIAVFAPSAAYLFDVDGFLSDWLARPRRSSSGTPTGMVPFVVPTCSSTSTPKEFPAPDSTAIWSDAAVWVPWALWQAYGDPQVLRDQYDSMTAHVRRVETLLSPEGLWDTGFQFGDWLDPDGAPDEPAAAKADPASWRPPASTAARRSSPRLPPCSGGSRRRRVLRAGCRARATAFNEHYVPTTARCCPTARRSTRWRSCSACSTSATASWPASGWRDLVAESGYRISTGFAGTPYICDALTGTGHLDDAYRLLLQRECPSWLYPVTMGATTVWERWDSMLPDGSINPGEMTSFNHYALGAVADWMHRTIGGIAPWNRATPRC